MNKFHYFSDFEHARWYVPPAIAGLRITKSTLDSKFELKYEIQKWVNTHCQANVWVLGNLSRMDKIIAIWFENPEDETLFKLTWADDIQILSLT